MIYGKCNARRSNTNRKELISPQRKSVLITWASLTTHKTHNWKSTSGNHFSWQSISLPQCESSREVIFVVMQTLLWWSIISAGFVFPISLEQLSLTVLLLPGLGLLLSRAFCGWGEPFRIPFSGGGFKAVESWYKPWVPLQKPGLVPTKGVCGERDLLKGSPEFLCSQD